MNFSALYKRIGRWIFFNPLKVLLFSILFAGLGGYFTSRISIQADLKELLPQDFDSVRGIEELKKKFGGIGYLLLGIEVNDPDDAFAFLKVLAPELSKIPEVLYVNTRRPTDFFLNHLPFYLEIDDLKRIEQRLEEKKEEMKKGANPIFDALIFSLDEGPNFDDIIAKYKKREGFDLSATEYYRNPEGTFFAALIKPAVLSSDIQASRRLVASVERTVDRLRPEKFGRGVTVSYGGDFKAIFQQEAHLKKEIGRISGIVLLLLMLILILYYRRLTPVFLIGIPLLAGILWTGGLIYFLLGHVNLVTGFSAAVLAGLGSDYGIYLLTRFLQEREAGNSSKKAYLNTFSRTSRATRGSAVTTMIAFGALSFSHFKGFSEFGLIGLIGTFLNLLSMHLLFPALVAFADQKGVLEWEKRFFPWSPRLRMKRTVLSLSLPLAVLFLTCGILTAAGIGKILPIEYDLAKFQNTSLESYRVDRRISALFKSSLHPAVIVVEGGEPEERAILKAIEAEAARPTGLPMIQEGIGLPSFIPSDQERKGPIIRRIQKLLREMRLTTMGETRKLLEHFSSVSPEARIRRDNLPPEIVQLFTRPDRRESFIYLFPKNPRDSAERVKAFAAQAREIPLENGEKITAYGDTLIIADILRLVEKEAPWILGLILLLCFLDLSLEFKSLKIALLLSSMLSFAVLLFLGGLLLFDLRFNFFNLVAPPIIIGTGCDSFIHLYHRYREHRHQVLEALNSMVPSISVANLTTMVGFGGLIATDNEALRSTGWMVILGMIAVTLTALLFLPALLTLSQRRNPLPDKR